MNAVFEHPDKTLPTLRLLTLHQLMLATLDDLKGTLFYSAKVHKQLEKSLKELEEYERTKIRRSYEGEVGADIANKTVRASSILLRLIGICEELNGQPLRTIEQFDRGLTNLCVLAGITPPPSLIEPLNEETPRRRP